MQINLTDKDTKVLIKALDAYIRLHIGSVDQAVPTKVALRGLRLDGRDLTEVESRDLQEYLARAQEIITGVRHGGPSIGNPRVDPQARTARKIQATLQGDDLPEGMYADMEATSNGV